MRDNSNTWWNQWRLCRLVLSRLPFQKHLMDANCHISTDVGSDLS